MVLSNRNASGAEPDGSAAAPATTYLVKLLVIMPTNINQKIFRRRLRESVFISLPCARRVAGRLGNAEQESAEIAVFNLQVFGLPSTFRLRTSDFGLLRPL